MTIMNNRDILIDILKKETNKKISEIIIDALFSDNIYNVWLNIKEMLRYNKGLTKKFIKDMYENNIDKEYRNK